MKGEELNDEPGRDLETLLEFIERLSNDPVHIFQSTDELEKFKLKHTDTFVLAFENKEADYYKCIERLVNDKFKQYFYIAAIDIAVYNSTVKTPALIVN
jgi:hypothetical protein